MWQNGAAWLAGIQTQSSAPLTPSKITLTTLMQTIPGSNLGEPLNVIISSASSPEILTDEGIASYLSSLYYSPNSCLGITLGEEQGADLNDGQGNVNQTELYRYNFGAGTMTCQESINGGEHIR